jgi:hypothetical protein
VFPDPWPPGDAHPASHRDAAADGAHPSSQIRVLSGGGRPPTYPSCMLLWTPSNPDARSRKTRSTIWTGDTVQQTESSEQEGPHLLSDVQTTPAPWGDTARIVPIEQTLHARRLLPIRLPP